MLAAVLVAGYFMLRSSGAQAATVAPSGAGALPVGGGGGGGGGGSIFESITKALTGSDESRGSPNVVESIFRDAPAGAPTPGPLPVSVVTVQDAPRVAAATGSESQEDFDTRIAAWHKARMERWHEQRDGD